MNNISAIPDNTSPAVPEPEQPQQVEVASYRRTLSLIVGSVVLVVLLAVGAVLLFGGKGDQDGASAPETFELTGAMALLDGATGAATRGECEGYRGYDDIAEGTQVTVYDASGKAVGLGRLANAEYSSGVCGFTFAVPDVPIGEKIYQVEVSHRGKVSFDAEAARKGDVTLTLG
ncbi:hypothetical protein [Saccharothrix sp. Mg75]|uniref:hypothetical protein n=1 Tax=Saccharothrix sp. Mg75 TaxID=3445357 RepID=UPI003EEAFFD4